MDDYKYHLQKYTTNQNSRHECPRCHDKHSFTYYVDDNDNVLDVRCGRCNHETGCGYHYTPSDYYRDHPECGSNDWRMSQSLRPQQKPQVQIVRPIDTLSQNVITLLFDKDLSSDLAQWLLRYFDKKSVGKVWQLYMISKIPNDGRTIFWQVDQELRVRTGKIMQYDPDTGHRLHGDDPRLIDKKVEVNWYHAKLKKLQKIPQEWQVSQCLFGEHLLKHLDKSKPVAVVEAEKTAVIAALRFPQFVWVSCGGLRQFSEVKMRSLAGRNVTLFPDADGYDVWCEIQRKISIFAKSCLISDLIRGDNDPNHKKWDIADYIIDEIDNPEDPKEKILKEICEDNSAIKELVADFDCVIISASKNGEKL